MADGMDALLCQPRLGGRTYSPHQFDRKIVKEIQLGLGIDNYQAVRFGHLRRYLRQMFGSGYANRDWKAKLRPHTAPYDTEALSGGQSGA
jgi:hypothetical protein